MALATKRTFDDLSRHVVLTTALPRENTASEQIESFSSKQAKVDIFSRFDMLQMFMLNSDFRRESICAIPALPREIMQLVLDCTCTIRRAAINPVYVYAYVTTRSLVVKTNEECINCSRTVDILADGDIKCADGHFNPNRMECPDCRHLSSLSAQCEYKRNTKIESRFCGKSICVRCAWHNMDKIMTKKIINNEFIVDVLDLKDSYIMIRRNNDGGGYIVCCTECMEEINKLL
jgi:hypothetical protein